MNGFTTQQLAIITFLILGCFVLGIWVFLSWKSERMKNEKKLSKGLQEFFNVVSVAGMLTGRPSILGRPTTYKEVRALIVIPFGIGLIIAILPLVDSAIQWNFQIMLNIVVSIVGIIGALLFYGRKFSQLAVCLMIVSVALQFYFLFVTHLGIPR